jgi:uncharacterized protein (TIGR02246 family)
MTVKEAIVIKVFVLMAASVAAVLADVPGTLADERGIREVIRAREAAWNSDNAARYRELMTEDADTISATGRSASGSDAVITLYSEQRLGVYKGATTATPIESIRFLRADVALVNTNFSVTGLRAADGTPMSERKGRLLFLLVKDQGRWLITAMRGMPETPIAAQK